MHKSASDNQRVVDFDSSNTRDSNNSLSLLQVATALEDSVAGERWASVVGSDRHEVSTLGRLRATKVGRHGARLEAPVIVAPRTLGEGYLGFGKQSALHVAVLTAFVGPCPEGREAAHRNGDRRDNRLENLRWTTHTENIADKQRHGSCSARRRPNLRTEERAEIRRRREAGESRAAVAAAFRVCFQTVSNACREVAR